MEDIEIPTEHLHETIQEKATESHESGWFKFVASQFGSLRNRADFLYNRVCLLLIDYTHILLLDTETA